MKTSKRFLLIDEDAASELYRALEREFIPQSLERVHRIIEVCSGRREYSDVHWISLEGQNDKDGWVGTGKKDRKKKERIQRAPGSVDSKV